MSDFILAAVSGTIEEVFVKLKIKIKAKYFMFAKEYVPTVKTTVVIPQKKRLIPVLKPAFQN